MNDLLTKFSKLSNGVFLKLPQSIAIFRRGYIVQQPDIFVTSASTFSEISKLALPHILMNHIVIFRNYSEENTLLPITTHVATKFLNLHL